MHESPTRTSSSIVIAYDHNEGIRMAVQLNRYILKLIGAWPKSIGVSWTIRCAYALLNVTCIGLITFLFLPCAIYAVLEEESTFKKLQLCGPISFSMMAILKYLCLIYHEKDIRKCIEHIENDWMSTQHYDDRTIMIKNARFGRVIAVISMIFMYSGVVIFFVAIPLSTGKITDNENLTYRHLVYPVARVVVDARYNPINEIFFWMQCLSGFITHSIAAAACNLAAIFVMHAYGRLEVLMQWIEHLIDGREDFHDSIDQRLMMIVKQHVRILRFVSLIEKVMCEISAMEVVGCTLDICLLGYYIIVGWDTRSRHYFTHFIMLISLTYNIFIYCYMGELISEQCKKVADTSYVIDWYRMSGSKGLALVLMIAMSNSSTKLTAGNIFDLSISTFGDVIKTSVAYLNALRTLTT